MRVGLNLVFLVPGETGGMETYARELVPRLAAIDGLEPIAFVNRAAAADGEGPWLDIPHEVVPVDSRNRFEWVRGEQTLLPRLAARAGCEVVHSLASTAPLWGRFRRVTTINDLNYKLVPEAHSGLLGLGMGVLVPAAARRSHRVIAISSSTAHDVESHLGVPAERIDTVLLAGSQSDLTAATAEPVLRQKLGLGERPILLTVSAKRPHKNLMRLIEAHARLDERSRPVLVMPGYRTSHEHELTERARELGTGDEIRMLGWIDPPDLEGLYAAARGFVFPSLYEGFGLPVLEAMRRGVPVACSDRSSLPEVAGDAALLFDPEDERAIASALTRLLSDGELRDRLRGAGPEQAARFSWDATAAGTVASYERALASPGIANGAR